MPEETTQATETTDQQTTQDTQNQDTTTEDTKTTETTEAEETKEESTLLGEKSDEEATPDVPEKYELKMPEGMELENALVDILSPVMKEVGLTQEAAQKLADAYIPYVQQQTEKAKQEALDGWSKQVDEWKNQTVQELGAGLKEAKVVASKFIDKFGSPKVREVLDDTGLGNHPELVKLFVKAGKAISEDTFVESDKKKGAEGGGIGKLYDNPTSKNK